MTTETLPDDWVLLEAAKRCGFPPDTATNPEALRRTLHRQATSFHVLCDMIAKHEKPPVDRKVLCAREAMEQSCDKNFRINTCDHWEWIGVRAIELWEEGFGK